MLEQLDDEPPDELEVRLKLGPPGGALAGQVVDPAGAPVPDASVLVGPEYGWPGPDRRRSDGGPPPIELTTDADGRFAVADLPAGATPLAVRAAGWSPWDGRAEIAAGVQSEVRIALEPSARIVGTVRDARGEVLAGARISTGRFASWDWTVAHSDGEGRYELHDVPLDERVVSASLEGVGRERRTFHVRAGVEQTWDPVLTLGLQIVGRVLDEGGAPVVGHHVQAEHTFPDGWGATGDTDAEGRFVVSNCDDVEHVLELFGRSWEFPALALVAGVRPGPDEVTIVVPADAHLLATVRGLVLDASGRPPPELHVGLWREGSSTGTGADVDPATGAFEFREVRAGRYLPSVQAQGFPGERLPAVDVRAGETLDLGTITLAAPGFVVVRFLLPPELDARQVQCRLERDGRFGTPSFDGREQGLLERRSPPLTPGEYVLVASGSHAIPVRLPVSLQAGEQQVVEVALERGVVQPMRFEMPYAEKRRVEVWLSDGQGALVEHESQEATPFPDRGISTMLESFVLRPGTYTLRAVLDGAATLEATLDVPAGAEVAPQRSFRFE